jgi:hypothetical protein
MSDIDLSELDFVLILIITYGTGVASGLCYCAKYRNIFLARSKSIDSFKQINNTPNIPLSPIIQATAPPPSHNPVKLTIE